MKRSIIFIFILSLIFACHKDIEIFDPDKFTPEVVAYCFLYPDSTAKVFVSKTVIPGYLNSNSFISDAKVKLLSDNTQEELTLKRDSFSEVLPQYYYYQGYTPIEENKIYSIEITALNKTVSGATTVPQTIPLKNINLSDLILNVKDTVLSVYTYGKLLSKSDTLKYVTISGIINLEIDDPPNQEDFYALVIQYSTFSINYNYDYENDTTYEYITHVYDEFWFDIIKNQNTPQNSFLDQIPGIFSQYTTALFFTDKLLDGKTLTFNLALQTNVGYSPYFSINSAIVKDTLEIRFSLVHLDQGYYNLLKSYNQFLTNLYNPFAEPINLYSNLDGGIGAIVSAAIYRKVFRISVQ